MPPARGDLYYIDIPQEYRGEREDFGAHMHVVVSREEINKLGKVVIVVPLTSPTYKDGHPRQGTRKDEGIWRNSRIRIPDDQKIWDEDAPHKQTGESLAKTEQMFCISQNLLGTRCGRVTDTALYSIEPGLCHVLNIPAVGRAKASILAGAGKPIQPPVQFAVPKKGR